MNFQSVVNIYLHTFKCGRTLFTNLYIGDPTPRIKRPTKASIYENKSGDGDMVFHFMYQSPCPSHKLSAAVINLKKLFSQSKSTRV